jgi:hypothetical protein
MSVGHERGPGPMLTLRPGVRNTVGGHQVGAGGSSGAHRAAGDVKLGRNDGKKLLKAMKQHGPSGGGRPMPMPTPSSSNASRLPVRANERDRTSSFSDASNGRGESGSLHEHHGPAKASLRSQKWSCPGEALLPVVVGGGGRGRSQSSDEDEASTSGDSNSDDDSETIDTASWLSYCCPCCCYRESAARRHRHLGSKGKMGSAHNHLLDGHGRTAHGGGGYGTQRMEGEFDSQGRAQNIDNEDSVADDNVQLLGRDGDDEFDSEWMIDSDDHQRGVQDRLGVGESVDTVVEAHDEFATDPFEALASQRQGGGGVGIDGSGSGGDGGGGDSDGTTSTLTTDDPFDTLPFEQHRSIIITNNNSGGSGGGGGGTIHVTDLFGDTDPFDTLASSRHGGVGDVPVDPFNTLASTRHGGVGDFPVDPFAPLPGHDESPNQHNA